MRNRIDDDMKKPESLRQVPNIPFEKQTLKQLREERNYWKFQIARSGGPASAIAAKEFKDACEAEIQRREQS